MIDAERKIATEYQPQELLFYVAKFIHNISNFK